MPEDTRKLGHLTRDIQPMPEDVQARLEQANLRDTYHARPAYQRNDYLAWIGRAQRPDTREKRIATMLDELELGGVYMKMDHPASRRD
jgi:uncharacterized protein YdeI (YjbR/CyaY-like superfamily)